MGGRPYKLAKGMDIGTLSSIEACKHEEHPYDPNLSLWWSSLQCTMESSASEAKF